MHPGRDGGNLEGIEVDGGDATYGDTLVVQGHERAVGIRYAINAAAGRIGVDGGAHGTLTSIENYWFGGPRAVWLFHGRDVAEEIIVDSGRLNARGNGGDDYFQGGPGADRLRGGEGDDGLFGVLGNDHLDGGPGTDELRGGPGTDSCRNGERYRSCETQE